MPVRNSAASRLVSHAVMPRLIEVDFFSKGIAAAPYLKTANHR